MATKRDYLPTRDKDLLAWGHNLFDKTSGSPALYGLLAAQVAAYEPVLRAFDDLVAQLGDPARSSEMAREQKKIVRVELVKQSRALVRVVQAFPGVTDAMRTSLKITVPDRIRTRMPAPTQRPTVKVLGAVGRRVSFRVTSVDRPRGKPAGALEVQIFTYVGAEPPRTGEGFEYRFASGKTTGLAVEFNHTVPDGAQVWVAACWANRTGQGPLGMAVMTHLPGGQATSAGRTAA